MEALNENSTLNNDIPITLPIADYIATDGSGPDFSGPNHSEMDHSVAVFAWRGGTGQLKARRPLHLPTLSLILDLLFP